MLMVNHYEIWLMYGYYMVNVWLITANIWLIYR